MKLEDIIRCVGINPYYANSDSQIELLKRSCQGINFYNGGMANAYIYIPYSEELNEFINNPVNEYLLTNGSDVHGGITYFNIEYGIAKCHCPYSGVISTDKWDAKYIVIGWDTNHSTDTHDKWTYRSIIKENEHFAKQILNIINENFK